LSLKLEQNGPKADKSRKLEVLLSDGWQRVYVDFAPDSEAMTSFFKTAGFNRSPTPPVLNSNVFCKSASSLVTLNSHRTGKAIRIFECSASRAYAGEGF
jgi:hypothetical protein